MKTASDRKAETASLTFSLLVVRRKHILQWALGNRNTTHATAPIANFHAVDAAERGRLR